MILNKTHPNPSDETHTIFMNNIVRRWPSVEKIYYLQEAMENFVFPDEIDIKFTPKRN